MILQLSGERKSSEGEVEIKVFADLITPVNTIALLFACAREREKFVLLNTIAGWKASEVLCINWEWVYFVP